MSAFAAVEGIADTKRTAILRGARASHSPVFRHQESAAENSVTARYAAATEAEEEAADGADGGARPEGCTKASPRLGCTGGGVRINGREEVGLNPPRPAMASNSCARTGAIVKYKRPQIANRIYCGRAAQRRQQPGARPFNPTPGPSARLSRLRDEIEAARKLLKRYCVVFRARVSSERAWDSGPGAADIVLRYYLFRAISSGHREDRLASSPALPTPSGGRRPHRSRRR